MKTVKVNTVKTVNQTVKVKHGKLSKLAAMLASLTFKKCVRLYKAAKAASLSDYRMSGFVANVRTAELAVDNSIRRIGQDVFLTLDKLGYGFLVGQALDGNTIAHGNLIYRLDAKKIVSRFANFKAFAEYVKRHGEKNLSGLDKDMIGLDTGAKYVVYLTHSGGVQAMGRSNGTGSHDSMKQGGKQFDKASVSLKK